MPTNRLSTLHGYVRMSWAPENLYNLARMSFGQAADMHERIAPIMRLKKSSMTMFQQKWVCKRLLRAYHGDWIPERSFRRRFLPDALPPLQANADSSSTLDKGKGRETAGADASKIPLGSLMWREVEARLDTLVFRACLAHSIYEARRLVTQGHVKLNGQLQRDPNMLLMPGDLFSVDPKAMYLLRQHDQPFHTQSNSAESAEAEGDAAVAADAPTPEAAEPAADANAASTSTPDASAADTASTEAAPSEAKPAPVVVKAKPPAPRRKELSGLPFDLPDYASPFLFIPAYLEVSFAACSAIYVRHPTARPGYSEIPSPYEADGEVVRLAWEFYKGVGRRRRGVRDWEHESRDIEKRRTAQLDDKGRRVWGASWEEKEMEARRMRAVRVGRGRWAHRPI